MIVAIVTLLGLLLRCLAARGGLWLDEAWSAIFAHDSATPAGVLLHINHDNNHHLNTLWLQWVGADAPPLLQRALSIVSGTATIPVAALIAARRAPAAAIVAAVAFAVSPFLLIYGAEARGYAPMLFAFLVAIAMTDRWLTRDAGSPATALALAAFLGCLAQATMVFGLAVLGLWVLLDRTRSHGPARAVADTSRLFAPAAIVTLLLVALAWVAAANSATGFQFGNREPHDWTKWGQALDQLWTWSLSVSLLLLPLLVSMRVGRDRLWTLALVAAVLLPLMIGLLALPNSGGARYYAVAVPPMLLCAAIALPTAWMRGGGWRWLAVLVAITFTGSAALRDAAVIANLRGDPGRAVATLARIAPQGASVSFDHSRSTAILTAAARSQHYPLRIADSPCPPARFHFIERDGDARFPAPLVRCGRTYREVARGDPAGLSGTHWRLYAALR
ncbi:MAG: hypothetical protein DI632_01760 [Sphingomonas hengshuiensis]|uniref:Glycosyltransferase RgtA/B/C/D-like domain-containing protein n=1 Tax=Sphingomonas hengshuiensis TaxID=1609977 RepID=A0A2W5BCH5_9SPHN|nr:MAG: hypothetical protein DI632_01760 [Sphingomonas hengshuiensis]